VTNSGVQLKYSRRGMYKEGVSVSDFVGEEGDPNRMLVYVYHLKVH